MKNIAYALKKTINPTWGNLLKILCLAIGILLGGVLLSRSAFINSYDKFLDTYDRTSFLVFHWRAGDNNYIAQRGLGPLAPEMMEKVPAVDKATRFWDKGELAYNVGENELTYGTLFADTFFFDIFPFEISIGDPKKVLASKSEVMISEKAAEAFFPEKDPIGQSITNPKGETFTVGGVFKNIPRNSFYSNINIIHSIENIDANSWNAYDEFQTFFTLKENISTEELNRQINGVFLPMLKWMEDQDMGLRISTHPQKKYTEFYAGSNGADTQVVGLYTLLGILLILVCAFNFALMQISSLVSRGKEVGVYKTNGATVSEIFAMVIWETIFFLIFALGLAAILLFALRGQIEGLMGRYEDIFATQHLWALALALSLVLIISGLLPALIYSKIPAVEVFRKSRNNNLWWKQGLLFLEIFISISVVIAFIATVLQYRHLTRFDLGYNYDNLVIDWFSTDETNRERIKADLLKNPLVESVTYTSNALVWGHPGYQFTNPQNGGVMFNGSRIEVDENFLETYGIKILGGNPDLLDRPNHAMISDDALALSNSTIGDLKFDASNEGDAIVGVFKSFITNLYSSSQPVALVARNKENSFAALTIKTTKEITKNEVAELNEIVASHLDDEPYLRKYQYMLDNYYSELRYVQYGFGIGAIVLILITLVGVGSYISTEIRSKRRELAIRRTHGATTWQIIAYVSKRLFIVTSISSALAIPLCMYGLNILFSSFFEEQIVLSWWIFASGVLLMTIFILIITYLQVSKISRRDYVKLVGKI